MQGEHRVRSGKMLPYDPSTHVPLLVRGPGIPAGRHSDELVANIDLAATLVDVADATAGKTVDGRSLMPFARNPSLRTNRAIRTSRWLYVRWRNGARELYDLHRDSAEMQSLHSGRAHRHVRRVLANRLRVLARCAGETCR
jgi:arylsulfatase A-like enzyme